MSCRTAFRPSTFFFLTLPPLFLKGVNLLELVSLCRCKGGRFMSFGKAWYSSLLDLVFFSSEGCECDRARNNLYVVARMVGSCHVGRPSA